jgi:capsular polysaccharide biosynthesis protein
MWVIESPTGPVTPGKIIFTLIGVFAGLALGCGLAAALELLDPTVRSEEAVESISELRVIASIDRVNETPAPA